MPTKHSNAHIAIKHPTITSETLVLSKRYVYILWTIAILLTVIMGAFPLRPGVLEFEFSAIDVLLKWTPIEKQWAAFGLGLDFLYMVIYSTSIAIGCLWSSRQLSPGSWAQLGIWLAWGQWIAALFDAAENISLISLLFGMFGVDPHFLALSSSAFATVKFFLILAGLLYWTACYFKSRKLNSIWR